MNNESIKTSTIRPEKFDLNQLPPFPILFTQQMLNL